MKVARRSPATGPPSFVTPAVWALKASFPSVLARVTSAAERRHDPLADGFTIRSPWRRIFNGGRALDILRSFEGLIGDKAYIEVLQRFIQIFDLHLVPERNAWCRLDKHGKSFALSEFQERGR